MLERTKRLTWGLGVAALTATAPVAAGQECTPEWDVSPGNPGLDHDPTAFAIYDDGSGPAVYAAAGYLLGLGEAAHVARWNGEGWEQVGQSFGGTAETHISDLAVYDDGTGPALYVSSGVSHRLGSAGGYLWDRVTVARLDNATGEWVALPEQPIQGGVGAMTVFDDGSGAKLVVGGWFDRVGEQPAVNIAAWNGSNWETMGEVWGGIYSFAEFDDGSGPALYAGGYILAAGEVGSTEPANQVVRWNGQKWTDAGGASFNGPAPLTSEPVVHDLEVHDDGSGPALFAAQERSPEPWLVAKFDGDEWTPLENERLTVRGFGTHGYALASFDDGTGSALYVVGWLYPAPEFGTTGIRRWDGDNWEEVGSGMWGAPYALLPAHLPGEDPVLWVGGHFTEAGLSAANRVARWVGCDVGCYADCDDSGDLDFFDFLCFQNEFAAGEADADCDESGDLDFFDFLCFQNEFAAGCP